MNTPCVNYGSITVPMSELQTSNRYGSHGLAWPNILKPILKSDLGYLSYDFFKSTNNLSGVIA